MGWLIYFIFVIFIFLLSCSLKKLKHFWFAGVIGMIAAYAIDSELIKLGAYSFRYPNSFIGNLPTLYWVGGFFKSIILIYYLPKRKLLQFPYILFMDFLFLCLERIMFYFGYFSYHNWSPINSIFLNVFGFIIVIWLWNWIYEIKGYG